MTSKDKTTRNALEDSTVVDSELLSGCINNDRRAQERLYELCHHQIHLLMIRIVGAQDAGDLTQQIFMQMFRKIDQFAGNSKFETWLYRLAVNEALQHLRKGRRWKHTTLVREPMGHNNLEIERIEQKELLMAALSKIEPELRSIFILREIENLSYREISEVVEIPEGTVGSRLNRSRRELQQHLSDLGWEV